MGVVDMYYVFNQTCIGYSHLKDKKPCQDFSASYQDNERIIITCCDGHGGAKYVRSQYGSKAASDAVLNIFKSIDRSFFYGLEEDKLVDKIKLLILCEYNRIIENYISEKPLRKSELVDLSEDDADSIRFNQAKAYGTTLSGAMIFQKRLIVVSIGDTEALGIRKGEIVKLFDN
ncbi:MAG: protein phosphatase 2C domain-containing protein, partial [Bacilli bacterium]|nr:protein phosphatase 2C domain-containing protein [Bacilli bacterium]